MKSTEINKMSKHRVTITGFIMIFISTMVFITPDLGAMRNFGPDEIFGLFSINYLLALAYMVILVINSFSNKELNAFAPRMEHLLLLLILFLISAFTLNKEIPIFERSSTWLSAYLVTQCIALMVLPFRKQLPSYALHLIYFVIGGGLILFTYFMVYLFPYYLFGIIGAIFLGISFHVFTPFFFTLFISIFLYRVVSENRKYLYPVLSGIALPIIIAVVFMIRWNWANNQMNYMMNAGIVSESTLPEWARLSQRIPANSMMETILKTNIVYSSATARNRGFFDMPNVSFEEARVHDPLVVTATTFFDYPDMRNDEKIKVLESMYDARHQTQERLWSGDKLETANVISNVRVFPKYRMAYTEKIISIANTHKRARRNRQEAIYTFKMPEGTVVSSLSLWIEGKEEKARLTTRSRADNAYKNIVGIERRDPSLVHWQEGNTVSVRVFPCTPAEHRKFKIGFSSPLRKDGERLIYENIHFKGPAANTATESIQLQFLSATEGIDLPFNFDKKGDKGYYLNKQYEPYWEISFASPDLSKEVFSFDGHFYRVNDYKEVYENFSPDNIYLDINESWSKEELVKTWEVVRNKNVYVFIDEMIKLNDDNFMDMYEQLSEYNFSVFPFHSIKNPGTALVISKSPQSSPNLQDLKESEFSYSLHEFLKQNEDIRLYNLGHQLSPYLKTLKELRVFNYGQGNTEQLANLIRNGKFIRDIENDSTVVIDNAGLIISEDKGIGIGNAPDHLLRLFAYNHLMNKISSSYFTAGHINDTNITEAERAYIVSPVSSLVVLETLNDYDRFNIKETHNNSLKNASMKSSGSVPEPHEWLLILLTASIVLYLISKSYFERKQAI